MTAQALGDAFIANIDSYIKNNGYKITSLVQDVDKFITIVEKRKTTLVEWYIIKGTFGYGYRKALSTLPDPLSHPNLAIVTEGKFEEQGGVQKYFVLTQYFEDGNLERILQQNFTIDFKIWEQWLTQTVEGMLALEKSDVPHLSLSLSKIYTKKNTIKITGMGLPRNWDKIPHRNYETLAPEVILRKSEKLQKAGVYSFGMILYQFVYKIKPYWAFDGSELKPCWTTEEFMEAVEDDQHLEGMLTRIASAPEELRVLLSQCWSTDPMMRPGFANVLALLENFMQYFEQHDWAITMNELRTASTPPSSTNTTPRIEIPPQGGSNGFVTVRFTMKGLEILYHPDGPFPVTSKERVFIQLDLEGCLQKEFKRCRIEEYIDPNATMQIYCKEQITAAIQNADHTLNFYEDLHIRTKICTHISEFINDKVLQHRNRDRTPCSIVVFDKLANLVQGMPDILREHCLSVNQQNLEAHKVVDLHKEKIHRSHKDELISEDCVLFVPN